MPSGTTCPAGLRTSSAPSGRAGEAAADGQPDGLATGEAIRAGLTDENASGQDAPDLAPAGPEPGDGNSAAGTSDDMFNADAIGALAGSAQGATAAAVPF